jgi:hypothetical protein
MRTGRITVPLDVSEAAALLEMAEIDCRSPHDQIRYLLRKDAQERGLLTCSGQQETVAQNDRRSDQMERQAA